MAGYFNKLMGYLYEGGYTAKNNLENGMFVEVSGTEVDAITAAATGLAMKVLEKTDLFGLPAVEVLVTDAGAAEVYMVENFFDENDGGAYDNSKYIVKKGDYVRMRRPETGDHMIISVDDTLYSTLNVGDKVQAAAKGVLAAVSTGD